MTIYIVQSGHKNHDLGVLGVFSSRELAEEFIQDRYSWIATHIIETEVDAESKEED